MNYYRFSTIQPQKAEAVLPLRKRRILPALQWVALWCLLWLALLPVATAATIEMQLQQHVEQELTQFLQQLGRPAQQQDIQLTVPAAVANSQCDNLQISRRQQQEPPLGRVSYTLSCSSPQRWQSRATARVELWLELVVAGRTLERDEVLTQDMLSLQSLPISSIRRGLEFDSDALLGMTVRRRINLGSPVSRHLLHANWLVQKGAQVTVQFSGEGFAVSTRALALSNGQLGERISVQNLSSGQIIDAIVVGADLVETGHK